MRAMFGLVSLLVVLGLAMLVFKYFEAPVIETGVKAEDQSRQISGRGDDGRAAIDSFQTQGKMRGSDLVGLTVTSVRPGGALDAVYGLRKDDEIISVDGMKVGDISVNDAETAKAMVVQKGFQGNLPIVVMRQGKQITLPDKSGSAASAAGNSAGTSAPGGTPAAGSPPASNPPQSDGVKDQLKNLGIQTH